MSTLLLTSPVLTRHQRSVKRLFDLIAGSVLLLVSAPLIAVCAVAIKLDSPGPAFYRPRRLGEGRRLFRMIKLRTMIDEADRAEAQLIFASEHIVFFDKQTTDPRVTRVGRFLRRWSLDEVPQLINVVKGEMSLVGPRPEMPLLEVYYSDAQRQRFGLPQGLTGWWQVSGRPQDIARKVELDLYYARHYSLWLDLWILIKTIGAVVSRRGAV